jgi:hypothetical protein
MEPNLHNDDPDALIELLLTELSETPALVPASKSPTSPARNDPSGSAPNRQNPSHPNGEIPPASVRKRGAT